MATIANLAVKVSADIQEFQSKMSGLQSTADKVGKNLTKYLTVPLVGMATKAVYTVSKFDDSMAKVRAISGETGESFDNMRKLAQDLGSTTAFSASQAADAMSYLALAGWDANQVMAATPNMLFLASAGAMDLAQAADIVSDTMSAYGMEATRAGEAADIFAAAQAKSNTNVLQLGEAMKYAGAATNAAGMDLAQTAAVLGVLADSGIKGSMAGTTVTSMMNDMMKAAEDGAFSVGALSIALYDAQDNMRDVGSIMADVEKATEGMSGAQKDAALGAIFGTQALKGVNIMLEAGADRYAELEAAMYNSTGTAEEMAGIMEDTLGGSIRSLGSALEGFMIQIGDHLKGPVSKAADFIGKLAGKFGELTPATQKAIIVVAALAAAVGPVLIVVGKLIGLMTHAATAIKAAGAVIGFLVSPIGLAVLAITALITIGVLLWRNWDTIKAKATELRDNLVQRFNEIKDRVVKTVQEKIDAIVNLFTDLPRRALKFVDDFRDGVISRFNVLKNVLVGNSIVPDMMDLVEHYFREGMEKSQEHVENGAAAIVGAMDKALGDVSRAISLNRQIIDAEFAMMKAAMGIATDESVILQLEISRLTHQYELQVREVEELTRAHRYMKSELGESAEETRKLYLELLKATSAMYDLRNAKFEAERQLYDLTGSASYERVDAIMRTGGLQQQSVAAARTGSASDWNNLMNFDTGGIVPGPKGKPHLAVVHGGETVLPAGAGGRGQVNVYIELDGKTLARAVGAPLVDEIRVRTGIRL